MPDIPVGTRGEKRRRVTSDVAIDFLGLPGTRVLGMPFMIMLMEMSGRNSVLPLLGEGYDTAGTEVRIRHLAAAPLGMEVTYRSELIAVEDRRLKFKVETFDEKQKAGEGTDERGINQCGEVCGEGGGEVGLVRRKGRLVIGRRLLTCPAEQDSGREKFKPVGKTWGGPLGKRPAGC